MPKVVLQRHPECPNGANRPLKNRNRAPLPSLIPPPSATMTMNGTLSLRVIRNLVPRAALLRGNQKLFPLPQHLRPELVTANPGASTLVQTLSAPKTTPTLTISHPSMMASSSIPMPTSTATSTYRLPTSTTRNGKNAWISTCGTLSAHFQSPTKMKTRTLNFGRQNVRSWGPPTPLSSTFPLCPVPLR